MSQQLIMGEAIDPRMSSGQPLFSGKVIDTIKPVRQARNDWEEQQLIPDTITLEQQADEDVAQEVAEQKEILWTDWAGTEQVNLKKWFFTLTPATEENRTHMENFLEFIQSDLLKAVIGEEGGDETVRERHFHGCLWFKYELTNLFVLKILFDEENFKPSDGKEKVYLNITEIRKWPAAVRYAIKGSVFLELRDGTIIKPQRNEARIRMETEKDPKMDWKLGCANLSEFMSKFPHEYMKHPTAYKDLWKNEEEHFDPKFRRNIKVNYFWGEAKSGKTYKATQEMAEIMEKNSWNCARLMVQRRGNGWMDGYKGEELLLIDEMRPRSLDYPWLLQMLDDYDCSAEIKGGRVNLKNLKEIWITSPYNVHQLFTNLDMVDSSKQLRRRITRILHCVRRKEPLLNNEEAYWCIPESQ
jgi:hypothetical protein